MDILSARISALTIITTQLLSVYLMKCKDPLMMAKEMQESAEAIVDKLRPEIQEEARRLTVSIFQESRKAAQQLD